MSLVGWSFAAESFKFDACVFVSFFVSFFVAIVLVPVAILLMVLMMVVIKALILLSVVALSMVFILIGLSWVLLF